MNIYCIHCGESFSITKEQLGKRGKCPHCHGTVVLPRSSLQYGYRERQIHPPSRWFEHGFSGLVAIAVHLGMLVLLALVPWGELSQGEGGEGDQIMIGQLARNQLVDAPEERLQPLRPDASPQDSPNRPIEEELLNLTPLDPLDTSSAALSLGAIRGGGQRSMQIESDYDQSVLAGGEEAFGKMISRLRKDGLDIVIVFDATGSMQGEIDEVKSRIQRIGDALVRMIPKTRIAVCAYRDRGDEYLVKGLPLTDNIGSIVAFLDGISARGGGDQPEAVDEGLRWAIRENRFRKGARKVILLFGDAPPHVEANLACQSLASEFRNRHQGIISTVTCRSETELDAFAAIARIGGGESFLTRNERQIMKQLIVLVFGSQYRSKVLEAFDLLR